MYTFLDMLRKYMPMLLPALVLGAAAYFELFYGYRMLAKSYSAHAFTGELMNILIFLPCGFLFALPL